MKTILTAVTCYILTLLGCLAGNISVETLGAVRHINIHDGVDYGAGVDLGLKLNSFVTGHVRALAYESDNWRGSTIDEGSLLIEARLLTSANKKLSLSAVGGVTRDFGVDDWGFGVGPRLTVQLTPNIGLVGESQIRAWFDREKDLITTFGIQFTF